MFTLALFSGGHFKTALIAIAMQVMVAHWLKFAIFLLFPGPVIEQSKGHGFTINGAVTRGSLGFGGKTCSARKDIGEEILGQGEVRT